MYKTCKGEITPILYNLFQRTETEELFLNSFSEVSITLVSKLAKDITRKEKFKSINLMNIDTKILKKNSELNLTVYTKNYTP